LGKGLRTAPRDALIADSTSPEIRGYAYGFQRAMDNGGAVGGSLFAAAVLAWSHVGLTNMILLSAIPGFAAILCLAAGVKEPPAPVRRPPPPPLAFSALSASLRRYLTVLGLFTLARASETFILLLGHDRGASTVDLLLLWAALNFAKALTSLLGGRMADRVSRGAVVGTSWSAYAVSFLLFALVPGLPALWMITLGYGLFAGFGEGAERAVISDFAPGAGRGSAFGWYNLVLGVVAIPAGLLFGGLWHYLGAPAAFVFAASCAAASVLLLRTWAWPARLEMPPVSAVPEDSN